MEKLTVHEVIEAGLDDWRQLSQGLHARFSTKNFVAGLTFVTAIGEAAEQMNHHPDVKLTYTYVDVTLISHDAGAITARDVDLARRISEIAGGSGVTAQPELLAEVELGLDTADLAAAGPFWAALLTGDPEARSGVDVVDPSGRTPLLWFQQTQAHETPRQRFHLDVWLPHDVAQARIALAVAAGGRVVDDQGAPSFTVLADPEGNRACVCTCLGRDLA